MTQMSEKLQKFIEDNIQIIEQNTKESFEWIYEKLLPGVSGEFTQLMIAFEVDPASIMGYIPEYYLYGSSIRNYTIPSNVTSIGECAFQQCDLLTNITIPDNVTSIGYKAFSGCTSLTSIKIPHSVTSIDEDAFSYCSSLTEINYLGTMNEAREIGIGLNYMTRWRDESNISKIICTDGVIEL